MPGIAAATQSYHNRKYRNIQVKIRIFVRPALMNSELVNTVARPLQPLFGLAFASIRL